MKKRILISLAIALLLVATITIPAVAALLVGNATAQPAIAADTGNLTAYVTLNSAISISVEDASTTASGINFGSVNINTSNNPDTGIAANIPSANVTVEAGTTVPVDLKVKGTDFGTSGLAITNVKFNTTFSTSGTTPMSNDDTTFALDANENDEASIWFWLDVPASGITAGSHQSTFTFTAVDST